MTQRSFAGLSCALEPSNLVSMVADYCPLLPFDDKQPSMWNDLTRDNIGRPLGATRYMQWLGRERCAPTVHELKAFKSHLDDQRGTHQASQREAPPDLGANRCTYTDSFL